MSNKKNPADKPVARRNASKSRPTEQELFWAGAFGDDYSVRNTGVNLIACNLALFAKILARTENVSSVLELGANIGLNLRAIRQLLPAAKLTAVEINARAAAELKKIPDIRVHHRSLLDFKPGRRHDFVFVKGVLIHINPEKLPRVYDLMRAASARYICIAEYYNPTPAAIPYRGHADRLFKRDFAGEMMRRFPGLRLVDYGFVYHGDPNHPQDDITWFLMEKSRA
ncbi:MAG: pseudaminic acid biosynthesis-associated methylase [Verrucomicrobiota bacterium]|jgi:spore coat polysaccharide biosynthesis protein SpsF